MKKKIAVLGAGLVGKAIARDLKLPQMVKKVTIEGRVVQLRCWRYVIKGPAMILALAVFMFSCSTSRSIETRTAAFEGCRTAAELTEACTQVAELAQLTQARRHGVTACFMAKPIEKYAGSGMHLHVSMLDDRVRTAAFLAALDEVVSRRPGACERQREAPQSWQDHKHLLAQVRLRHLLLSGQQAHGRPGCLHPFPRVDAISGAPIHSD